MYRKRILECRIKIQLEFEQFYSCDYVLTDIQNEQNKTLLP